MWWQTNSQRILYFTPKSFFFINNLNKLPLGVDFTAGGGLNQLQIIHSAFAPNSLRIYSDNFLQCMNVNNESFDICKTQVSPKKKMSP
jgi:hypothetical protein